MVDRRLRGTPKTNRSSSSTPSAASAKPSITIIYTDIVGQLDERRSFQHFRIRTADDLSGYFDSNFWNRLILQLSHSEPAIKHALIALGAAHESYQAGHADSLNSPSLALKQYNKAISCLKQQLLSRSRRNTEVALICCVLFICFESVRGDYDAALLHLKSGIEILKNKTILADKDCSGEVPYLDPETDEDDLIELFTRLDVSASAFLDIQPPQLAMRLSEALPYLETNTPFRDLVEARKYLQRLANMSIRLALSQHQYRGKPELLPVEAEIERRRLSSVVQQWAVKFDALLKSPAMVDLSGRNLQGAFTLIAQQKTIYIILEVSPHRDMRRLWSYEKDIENVVSICSWLIRPSGTLPHPDSASPIIHEGRVGGEAPKFTADMGVIAPLYYVAIHCPNQSIRQRALDLLKVPRREGLWDSVLTSQIAERIMDADGQAVLESFTGSVVELAEALGAAQKPSVSI